MSANDPLLEELEKELVIIHIAKLNVDEAQKYQSKTMALLLFLHCIIKDGL